MNSIDVTSSKNDAWKVLCNFQIIQVLKESTVNLDFDSQDSTSHDDTNLFKFEWTCWIICIILSTTKSEN